MHAATSSVSSQTDSILSGLSEYIPNDSILYDVERMAHLVNVMFIAQPHPTTGMLDRLTDGLWKNYGLTVYPNSSSVNLECTVGMHSKLIDQLADIKAYLDAIRENGRAESNRAVRYIMNTIRSVYKKMFGYFPDNPQKVTKFYSSIDDWMKRCEIDERSGSDQFDTEFNHFD